MTPTQFITACYRMASYYGITLPDTMTEGDAVRAMHYAGVDHPGDATAMVAPRTPDGGASGLPKGCGWNRGVPGHPGFCSENPRVCEANSCEKYERHRVGTADEIIRLRAKLAAIQEDKG